MQTFNLKFQIYFIRDSVSVRIDIFMFTKLMINLNITTSLSYM